MTCTHRHSNGAYVLGALSPAERDEFEAHLSGCAECGTTVQEMAPLPGLLSRVDPAELDEPTAPTPLLSQLLDSAARSKRRWAGARRRRLVLAVAAVVLVVAAGAGGAVAISAISGSGLPEIRQITDAAEQTPPVNAMRPVADSAPVTADLRMAGRSGGTEVWMRCRYSSAVDYQEARTFRLVAVGPGGASEQLGSWRASPGGELELTGVTHLSGAELVRIELQNARGEALLAYEP